MTKTKLILTIIGTALAVGCATTNSSSDPMDPDNMAFIAELAAYDGAALYLADHPEAKAKFEEVRNRLLQLSEAGTIDAATFLEVMRTLHIRELQSEKGSILVGSALILWDRYAKTAIDLDTTKVKPVLDGVRRGLDRALGSPSALTPPPAIPKGKET